MKNKFQVSLWIVLILLIIFDIGVVVSVWFFSNQDFKIRIQITTSAVTATLGSAISILGAFLVSSRQFNNELIKAKSEKIESQKRIQNNLLYELSVNQKILTEVVQKKIVPSVAVQGFSFVIWEKVLESLEFNEEVTQKIFSAYSKLNLLLLIPKDALRIDTFVEPLDKANKAIAMLKSLK
ncbi:hypothetical protein [Lactiplantibacillus plantarum]|uniref:hypothetical protein n=1 Tax=Lactiplantibacillus plantarum TaxID=1590 RepID=UPI00223FB7DA|nr:hypothetical protein [Lactiplantibacillus plantarum]